MPGNTVSRDGDRFSEYDPRSHSRGKRPNSSAVSISTEEITIRELTHLVGRLTATTISVLPAPLQYRAMQRQQILGFSTEKNYDSLITLTEEMKGELNWWV